MFIFYFLVAALIWAGISYCLHKNKPLKNANEALQIYFIIASLVAIILALIILIFFIYTMISNKSLASLPWAIICMLVITVAILFFKENIKKVWLR